MKWSRIGSITVAVVLIALFCANIPQSAAASGESLLDSHLGRVASFAEELNTLFRTYEVQPAELFAFRNYTATNPVDWHVDLVKVVQVREWVWDPITPSTYYLDAGGHQHGVRHGRWVAAENVTQPQAHIDARGWIHWLPNCGPNRDTSLGRQSTMATFEEDLRSLNQRPTLITESMAHFRRRLEQEYQDRQRQHRTVPSPYPHLDDAARTLLQDLEALGRSPAGPRGWVGIRATPTEQLAGKLTRYLNAHYWEYCYPEWSVRATGPGAFALGCGLPARCGWADTSQIYWSDGRCSSWEALFDEVCTAVPVSLPSPDLRLAVVTGNDANRNQMLTAIQQTIAAGRLYAMVFAYTPANYANLFHYAGSNPPEIDDYQALWVCSQADRQGWELTRYERDVLACWLRDGGTLILGGLDSSDAAKRRETWLPTEAYTQFYPASLFEEASLSQDGWGIYQSQGAEQITVTREAGYVGQGLSVRFGNPGAVNVRLEKAISYVSPGICLRFYHNLSLYYLAQLSAGSNLQVRVSLDAEWEDSQWHTLFDDTYLPLNMGQGMNRSDGVWHRFTANALDWARLHYGETLPDWTYNLRIEITGTCALHDTLYFDELAMVTQRDYNLEPYLDMDIHDGAGYGDSCDVYTWESLAAGADDRVGWTTRSLNGSMIFHVWAALPGAGVPPGPYPDTTTSQWWEARRGPSWIEYINTTYPIQKRRITGLDLTNLGTVASPQWVQDSEYTPTFVLEMTNHSLWTFTDATRFTAVLAAHPTEVFAVGLQTSRGVAGFPLDPATPYAVGQLLYGPRLPDRTLPSLGTAMFHIVPRVHVANTGSVSSVSLGLTNRQHWRTTGTDPRFSVAARVNVAAGWSEVSYTTSYAAMLSGNWSYTVTLRAYSSSPHPCLKLQLTSHSYSVQNLGISFDLLATGWRTGYDLTELAIHTTATAAEERHLISVIQDVAARYATLDPQLRLLCQNQEGFLFDLTDMKTSGFASPHLQVLDVSLPWGGMQRVVQAGLTGFGKAAQNTPITIDPTLIAYGTTHTDDVYASKDSGSNYEGAADTSLLRLGVDDHLVPSGDWYNSAWTYRKSHVLTSTTTLTNYQMKVVVKRQTGTSSGGTVYVGTNCRADFADVRFTKGDGLTLLDYWLESSNSTTATFWVEVPQLIVGSTTTYVYYGNPSASSASNGDATFLFFDDFTTWNAGKWSVTEYTGGTHSREVTNGELHVYAYSATTSTSGYAFRTAGSWSDANVAIYAKTRWANLDNYRGAGDFLGVQLIDGGSQATGETVSLYGDYRTYLYRWRDGVTDGLDPDGMVQGPTSGNAYFSFTKVGSSWSIGLSGTFSHTWSGSITTVTTPYRLQLDAYVTYWTASSVQTDSYYDYLYMRKYASSEPTHGSWGSEQTPPLLKRANRVLTRFSIAGLPPSPVQRIDSAFLFYPINSSGGTHSHTVWAIRTTNASWDSATNAARWAWATTGTAVAATVGTKLSFNVTSHVQALYDVNATMAAWRLWTDNDAAFSYLDWYLVKSNCLGNDRACLNITYSEKPFAPTVTNTAILGMEDDGGWGGPNWLDLGWQYRKSHTVTGSTGGALTDYQVRVRVYYGSGTDAGDSVYTGSRCQADFDDVRFTAADGITLLSHWRESYTVGSSAVFWVKLPSIPASPGTTTFYVYYGNGGADSASNLDATMIFGDDFTNYDLDPAKWTAYEYTSGSHYWVVDDSALHVHAESSQPANSGYYFTTVPTWSATNVVVTVKGSWRYLDYWRGGGDFLGTHVLDSLQHDTGYSVGLRGDYGVNLWRYADYPTNPAYEWNPSDTTPGEATVTLAKLGSSWTLTLTGTYTDAWSGTLNVTTPYRLRLASFLAYWTQAVAVDAYFDYVYLRNYAASEPTHGSWGAQEGGGTGAVDNCYAAHAYSVQTRVTDLNRWQDIQWVNVSIGADVRLTYHYYFYGQSWVQELSPSGTVVNTSATILQITWTFTPGWGSSVNDASVTSQAKDYASLVGQEVLSAYVDLIRELRLDGYAAGDTHVNPGQVVSFSGQLRYRAAGGVPNRWYAGAVQVGYFSGGQFVPIGQGSSPNGVFSVAGTSPAAVAKYGVYPLVAGAVPFAGQAIDVIVDQLMLVVEARSEPDGWANLGDLVTWTFRCHYAYNGSLVRGWTLRWNLQLYTDTDKDGRVTVAEVRGVWPPINYPQEPLVGYALWFNAVPADDNYHGITTAGNSTACSQVWTAVVVTVSVASGTAYPVVGQEVVLLVQAQWAHNLAPYWESVVLLRDGVSLGAQTLGSDPTWTDVQIVYRWCNYTPESVANGYGVSAMATYSGATVAWSADTDLDTYADLREIFSSYTNPLCNDTDADGLPDAWEFTYPSALMPGYYTGFEYGYAPLWVTAGILNMTFGHTGNVSWRGLDLARDWDIADFVVGNIDRLLELWVYSPVTVNLTLRVFVGQGNPSWYTYAGIMTVQGGFWQCLAVRFVDFVSADPAIHVGVADTVRMVRVEGGTTDLLIDDARVSFDDYLLDPDGDGKPNHIEYAIGSDPANPASPAYGFTHSWLDTLAAGEQFSTTSFPFVECRLVGSANALVQLCVGTWTSEWLAVGGARRLRFQLPPGITVTTLGLGVQSWDGYNATVELCWLTIYDVLGVPRRLTWQQADGLGQQNPKTVCVSTPWASLLTQPNVVPTLQTLYSPDVQSLLPSVWVREWSQNNLLPGAVYHYTFPVDVTQLYASRFPVTWIASYPTRYNDPTAPFFEDAIRPSPGQRDTQEVPASVVVALRQNGEYPSYYLWGAEPQTMLPFLEERALGASTTDREADSPSTSNAMQASDGPDGIAYHLWYNTTFANGTRVLSVCWVGNSTHVQSFTGTLLFHHVQLAVTPYQLEPATDTITVTSQGAVTILQYSASCGPNATDPIDGFNLLLSFQPVAEDKVWQTGLVEANGASVQWSSAFAGGVGYAMTYVYAAETTQVDRIDLATAFNAYGSSSSYISEYWDTDVWLNGFPLPRADQIPEWHTGYTFGSPCFNATGHPLAPGFNRLLVRVRCHQPLEDLVTQAETTHSLTTAWALTRIALKQLSFDPEYHEIGVNVASMGADPYTLHTNYVAGSLPFEAEGAIFLYGFLDSEFQYDGPDWYWPRTHREGMVRLKSDGQGPVLNGEWSVAKTFAENFLEFLIAHHDKAYTLARSRAAQLVGKGKFPTTTTPEQARERFEALMVKSFQAEWNVTALWDIGMDFDQLIDDWGYAVEGMGTGVSNQLFTGSPGGSWASGSVDAVNAFMDPYGHMPHNQLYFKGIYYDPRYISLEHGDPLHGYQKPYISICRMWWPAYNTEKSQRLGDPGTPIWEFYRVYGETHVERTFYNPHFVKDPNDQWAWVYAPGNTMTMADWMNETVQIWGYQFATWETIAGDVVSGSLPIITQLLQLADQVIVEPWIDSIFAQVTWELQQLLYDLALENDTEAYALDLPSDEGTVLEWLLGGPWHGFRSFASGDGYYALADAVLVSLMPKVLEEMTALRPVVCAMFDIDSDTTFVVTFDPATVRTHWPTVEEALQRGAGGGNLDPSSWDYSYGSTGETSGWLRKDTDGNLVPLVVENWNPNSPLFLPPTERFAKQKGWRADLNPADMTKKVTKAPPGGWLTEAEVGPPGARTAAYERLRITPPISPFMLAMTDAQFAECGRFAPFAGWIGTSWQVEMRRLSDPSTEIGGLHYFGVEYHQSVWAVAHQDDQMIPALGMPMPVTHLYPIGTIVVHNVGDPNHAVNQYRLKWARSGQQGQEGLWGPSAGLGPGGCPVEIEIDGFEGRHQGIELLIPSQCMDPGDPNSPRTEEQSTGYIVHPVSGDIMAVRSRVPDSNGQFRYQAVTHWDGTRYVCAPDRGAPGDAVICVGGDLATGITDAREGGRTTVYYQVPRTVDQLLYAIRISVAKKDARVKDLLRYYEYMQQRCAADPLNGELKSKLRSVEDALKGALASLAFAMDGTVSSFKVMADRDGVKEHEGELHGCRLATHLYQWTRTQLTRASETGSEACVYYQGLYRNLHTKFEKNPPGQGKVNPELGIVAIANRLHTNMASSDTRQRLDFQTFYERFVTKLRTDRARGRKWGQGMWWDMRAQGERSFEIILSSGSTVRVPALLLDFRDPSKETISKLRALNPSLPLFREANQAFSVLKLFLAAASNLMEEHQLGEYVDRLLGELGVRELLADPRNPTPEEQQMITRYAQQIVDRLCAGVDAMRAQAMEIIERPAGRIIIGNPDDAIPDIDQSTSLQVLQSVAVQRVLAEFLDLALYSQTPGSASAGEGNGGVPWFGSFGWAGIAEPNQDSWAALDIDGAFKVLFKQRALQLYHETVAAYGEAYANGHPELWKNPQLSFSFGGNCLTGTYSEFKAWQLAGRFSISQQDATGFFATTLLAPAGVFSEYTPATTQGSLRNQYWKIRVPPYSNDLYNDQLEWVGVNSVPRMGSAWDSARRPPGAAQGLPPLECYFAEHLDLGCPIAETHTFHTHHQDYGNDDSKDGMYLANWPMGIKAYTATDRPLSSGSYNPVESRVKSFTWYSDFSGSGPHAPTGKLTLSVVLRQQAIACDHFASWTNLRSAVRNGWWDRTSLSDHEHQMLERFVDLGLRNYEFVDGFKIAVTVTRLRDQIGCTWQQRIASRMLWKAIELIYPNKAQEMRNAITGVDPNPSTSAKQMSKVLLVLGFLGAGFLLGLSTWFGQIPTQLTEVSCPGTSKSIRFQTSSAAGALAGLGLSSTYGGLNQMLSRNPLSNTFAFQLAWAPAASALGTVAALKANEWFATQDPDAYTRTGTWFDRHASAASATEHLQKEAIRWASAIGLSVLVWVTDYMDTGGSGMTTLLLNPLRALKSAATDFIGEMINCVLGGFQVTWGALMSSAVTECLYAHADEEWTDDAAIQQQYHNIPTYVIDFAGLPQFLRHLMCYPSAKELSKDGQIQLRTRQYYPCPGWLGTPGQSDAWWRFPCSIPADHSRAYYPDGLNYNNPYYYLRPEVVNDPSWAGEDEQWLPVFEPNVGCRIVGLGMHEWDDAYAINDGPWLPTGLAAYWDLSWSVVLMCLGAAVSFYTGTEFSQRLTGVLASMFANVAAAAFLNWLNQRGAQAILDRAWWRTFEGTRGWGSLEPVGGPPLLWVPP